MASPIELLVRVDSDASGVADDFDKVAASAKDMGTAVDRAGSDADGAVSKMDRAASGAENMDDKFGKATGALGALSAGLSVVGLEEYAGAMDTAAMATDGLSGVGQALSLVMELESVQTAKNTAINALHAAQTWLSSAATKAWAATQWLLNAAMSANPIGLVVIAVVALIAVFVIAYQKSETFRAIVDKLWSTIKDGAEAAARIVKDAIGKAWDTLKAILSWSPADTLRKAWDAVSGVLKHPFEVARDWIQGLFAAGGPIADALGKPLNWIAGVVSGFIGLIKHPFETVRDWISGLFSADGAIATALGKPLNWIAGVVSGITGLIKAPFETALGWIQTLFGENGAIKHAIDGLVGIVRGVLQPVVDAINALIRAINKLPGPNLSYVSNPLSRGVGATGYTAVTTGGAGRTAGAVVATGGRGLGTTVTINITGAIDPYQTGRQVEKALARSGLVVGRVTA